jgi:2-dehydropantoate 2-reductase
MRYIIIGAGAVGGTIGGCLHQAGYEVVLVARGAHLEALRSSGLRLATPAGTSTLRIDAVASPGDVRLRPDDVLVVATKTQDVSAVFSEWAWQPVGPGSVADTLPVLCAQNGVASERMALRLFRNVYGVCVWLPATHLSPGVVEAQGTPLAGQLNIGRYPSGIDPTTELITADLTKARFLAPASDDVMRWKYGKLLANLMNAVEALCGPLSSLGDDARELRQITRAEGEAALTAAGIGWATAAESAAVRGDQVRVEPANGTARSGGSSWQSLIRGTGSVEADYLNGEIALLGREHGVPTPLNELLQRLANQAARAHTPPGSITPTDILARLAGLPGSGPTARARNPIFGQRRALCKRLHRPERGATLSKGAPMSKAEAACGPEPRTRPHFGSRCAE